MITVSAKLIVYRNGDLKNPLIKSFYGSTARLMAIEESKKYEGQKLIETTEKVF